MCGDDDESGEIEERLYARFVAHAKTLLGQHAPRGGDDPYAYMDKLFADALSRCARDAGEADGGERATRLAAQPRVLARLAGFLASHLPADEDPLRQVIDALMLGYGEAERLDQAHDHGHEH
jgi:hypothetical protein